MHPIERRLSALGFSLPEAAAPVASYAAFVIHQQTLIISGQLPFSEGALLTGHCGDDVSTDEGAFAAQQCALMVLAQAKAACGGSFDRLDSCLKITGFVASTPSFTDHPKVINGASDLIGNAMEDAGIHARAAVGVASLPLGAVVEVEAFFSLKE